MSNRRAVEHLHRSGRATALDLISAFGSLRHDRLVRTRAAQHLRLLPNVTQMGPSAHTLKTFGKALVESRLFYAMGGWGAKITPDEHT